MPGASNLATWIIAALATAGVIFRPLRLPEGLWAMAGAVALVCFGLLPAGAAVEGMARGVDVYLFLVGMMLLAELAAETGLFDWLAALAASHARGSASRLFDLIYLVGILVTTLLSNDATAVVLTPAVAAVARSSRVADPVPYLLICAFIANAASFVLPISNPANLVIYASHLPPLAQWLPQFALPSAVAICATYALLRYTQREALRQPIAMHASSRALTLDGKAAALGIAVTAVLLVYCSARGWQLGLPTALAGAGTLIVVTAMRRAAPWPTLGRVSWGILPLVAGLFVLVAALERTGAIHALSDTLRWQLQRSGTFAAADAGLVVGFATNLMNNLPAGLLAGTAVHNAALPASVSGAILLGVDLGPNLSVTGSLATILWLTALRRAGIQVRALDFLKLGLLIMPASLLLALGALLLQP